MKGRPTYYGRYVVCNGIYRGIEVTGLPSEAERSGFFLSLLKNFRSRVFQLLEQDQELEEYTHTAN